MLIFFLIFSVEFIGYFLDRDARLNRLKKQLSHHAENKTRLTNDQQTVQTTYDNVSNFLFENTTFYCRIENL